MTIKIKIDKKANIFLTQIGREIPRMTPKASALAAGRIKNRIGQEIRSFAKKRTGKLERSFEVKVKRGPTRVTIFSPLPYAAIHEHGGLAGRRTSRVRLPAQRYLTKALQRSLPDLEKTFRQGAVQVVEFAAGRAR